MNYCNCPNCRTENCPAGVFEAIKRDDLKRLRDQNTILRDANKSLAESYEKEVIKLKDRNALLEKEIADMLKAELEELTVLKQAKTLLEKMVKELGK